MKPEFDRTDISILQEALINAKRICLITHQKPDGDALGSMLALEKVLKTYDGSIQSFSPDLFPNFLSFLEGSTNVIQVDSNLQISESHFDEADIIFCLDFNDLNRTGKAREMIKRSKAMKVMIDHHIDPREFADVVFSFPKAAATAEIVYYLIHALGKSSFIDETVASALYCGIMTDTGSFRFSGTSKELHLIVADLFTTGFNHTLIHEHIFDSFTESRLRLLGHCLSESMTIIDEYKVCLIELSSDLLRKYKYQTGDSEGFVNYGLSIGGIQLAVLFSEREGEVGLSIRSKGDVDACSIAAKYFGGGGHKNAAGGKSTLSLEDTIQKFISLLPEMQANGYIY